MAIRGELKATYKNGSVTLDCYQYGDICTVVKHFRRTVHEYKGTKEQMNELIKNAIRSGYKRVK